MYCKNCGEQIDDKAVICPKCGVAQNNFYNNGPSVDPNDAPSAGFAVLGFFFPIVGLILYLVWQTTSPLKAKSAGKGALVSVIVSAVFVVFYVIIMVVVVTALATSGGYNFLLY